MQKTHASRYFLILKEMQKDAKLDTEDIPNWLPKVLTFIL